jgi:plasmid stabilization system protein ParE
VAFGLRITFRAAVEIEKAHRWWLENRPLAPAALWEDLEAALNVLVRQPEIGTRMLNARLTGVRRLHLGRIRYDIYYRVKGSELVVLSLWHSSRGSGPSV